MCKVIELVGSRIKLSTAILISKLVFFTLYTIYALRGLSIVSSHCISLRNLGHLNIPASLNIYFYVKPFLKSSYTFSACVPCEVMRYVHLLCALQIPFYLTYIYLLNVTRCLIFYYILNFLSSWGRFHPFC